MDDGCEFDDGVAAEDGIVWVVDFHHINGDCLSSLCVIIVESDVQLNFAEGLYSFASEANC